MSMTGRDCRELFGRWTARGALAAAVAGSAAFVAGMALARAQTFAALEASWLLFAGIAAGAVALAASIRIARGEWAGAILETAERASGFFRIALALLVLLWATARAWHPHASEAWALPATRDLIATAITFWIGRRFVRWPSGAWGVAYVLGYVVTLSLWIVDLVMDLGPGNSTTALPAYYFMAAFLSGLAWSTLAASVRRDGPIDPQHRHDAGKLLFGMIAFVAYLLWAIFLPTWYANLPEEAGLLLSRWTPSFRPFSAAVLALGILAPFFILLTEWAKRQRALLVVSAALVLVGLTCERFLLVLPPLHLAATPAAWLCGAGTFLGVAGTFLLLSTKLIRATEPEGEGADAAERKTAASS